jgi:hypothetical protein
MPQRPQQTYDRSARITFDNRAGLDVPMLYDAEWTLTGPAAAPFRAVIGQGSEEQLDDFVEGFARRSSATGWWSTATSRSTTRPTRRRSRSRA